MQQVCKIEDTMYGTISIKNFNKWLSDQDDLKNADGSEFTLKDFFKCEYSVRFVSATFKDNTKVPVGGTNGVLERSISGEFANYGIADVTNTNKPEVRCTIRGALTRNGQLYIIYTDSRVIGCEVEITFDPEKKIKP